MEEHRVMTLIEQMLNIQEYGNKGGRMNLEQARADILNHHQEKKKNKQQRKENELLIEKIIFDVIKASGNAIVKQAIEDLMQDFNKGH